MRILQLANKMPYPPKDGGALGIHVFTEGLLAAGHSVKVIAVNTPKLFTPDSEIDEAYRKRTGFECVTIDTSVKALDAFKNLFTSESYNVARFISPAMEQKLQEVLSNDSFDIVQLESIYMAPYLRVIRKYSKAKVVLRAHNIEYKIWERLAVHESNPIKRWYLQLLTRRLKAYEQSMLNSYDGITYITPQEGILLQQMGCKIPVAHIPFAMDVMGLQMPQANEQEYSVFSLAAMDWQPNIEGLKWFLNEVWQKVVAAVPQAKFYIAGRNMGSEWQTTPNVIAVGEVKDAKAFVASKQVMVVPLLAGGGMRVKIVEGFAMGKPMVATAIGAEGISYISGAQLLEANDANGFANAVITLLKDAPLRRKLAANARQKAETDYDTRAVVERLTSFYQSILGG